MHPVHDIEVPADIASFVPTVIEIPRGSHLKYEVDKPTGLLKLDHGRHEARDVGGDLDVVDRVHLTGC
ncbi:MAG: hypothetical protein ACM31C_25180 [Acidobacteriota bacterium]